MFVLEGKKTIVLFINRKIFQKIIYKYFYSQFNKIIKPYLVGNDENMVSEIITRIVNKKELNKLYKNIRNFLNKTKSNLEINHILEYYINEDMFLDKYLYLEDFQVFLNTLTVNEIFKLLRINDYILYTNQIDTEDENFKKIYSKNNIIYLKWRKY